MARSIRRANAAEALTSNDNKDFPKNHFGRKILRQVFGEFSSLTREIGQLTKPYEGITFFITHYCALGLPSLAPMSRPPLTNENLLTREVWGTNLDEELSIIREMLEEYPYIAIDTEFPGVVRLENNFSCEV